MPLTYPLASGQGDFGYKALDLAPRSGEFEPGDCRVVDHDPETHQLRGRDAIPFEDARGLDDPRHFEVILQSRVEKR